MSLRKELRKQIKNLLVVGTLLLLGLSGQAEACQDIDGIVDHNCDRQLVIICFGDSITFGVRDETGLGYPGWLNLLLPNAFILNAGISGERTPTGLARAPGVFTSIPNPDYIVILEGVNDFFLNTSAAATRANLLRIEQVAAATGAVPLLGTLIHVNRGFQVGWVNAVNRQIEPFTEVDFFSLGPGVLSSDDLHPDATGYQMMANLLQTRLVDIGNSIRPVDTDQDGIYDFAEPSFGSDPLIADTDGDSISDGDEVFVFNSNPTSLDSDGDGLSDSDEVNVVGSNPGDPRPGAPTIVDSEIQTREILNPS